MINIDRYNTEFVLPVLGDYIVLQNQFNWKEWYIITLELLDFNGSSYCYNIELPECINNGMYNYYITNNESINPLNITNSYFEEGFLVDMSGKPVLFNGKILSLGYSKSKVCILDSGVLNYSKIDIYECK